MVLINGADMIIMPIFLLDYIILYKYNLIYRAKHGNKPIQVMLMRSEGRDEDVKCDRKREWISGQRTPQVQEKLREGGHTAGDTQERALRKAQRQKEKEVWSCT